jgi:hypothetical protein
MWRLRKRERPEFSDGLPTSPCCSPDEKRRQEAQERAEEYAEGGDGEAAIRQAMHEALDR